MNFIKTYPAVTAILVALSLGTAGLAAASDSGLSHSEQSAQQAIVGSTLAVRSVSNADSHAATLADNERAARGVIAVDFGPRKLGTTLADEATTLAANELAAQHSIVDAPVVRHRIVPAAARAETVSVQAEAISQ